MTSRCVTGVALAVALSVAENAVMAQSIPPGRSPPPCPEIYLNPDEPITVAAGRPFAIRLASNPTTGFGWQLAGPPDPRVARCLTNRYEPPDSRLCGAGGHELWTFEALKPGRTTATLQYTRPWERDTPPSDVKRIRIVVHE